MKREADAAAESSPAEDRPSFEKNLERLEEIVGRLERGEMSLEESLQVFEEGVGLTRTLDARLSDAEMKVERLLRAAREAGGRDASE